MTDATVGRTGAKLDVSVLIGGGLAAVGMGMPVGCIELEGGDFKTEGRDPGPGVGFISFINTFCALSIKWNYFFINCQF